MNLMITRLTDGLNVSWEIVLLILFVGACIVFFAKGFQFGLMLTMVISAVLFIVFYLNNLDYTYIIVIFFLCFILLSLSLYSLQRVKSGGYI